jgi:hypothetical protein
VIGQVRLQVLIGAHAPEHHSRYARFKGAQCSLAGVTVVESSLEVGPSGAVHANLDDGDPVNSLMELAVAASGGAAARCSYFDDLIGAA